MRNRVLWILLAVCLAIGLTACGNEQGASDTVSVPETVEMTETITEATEPAVPKLLEHLEDGKIGVGFLPTEVGAWRYAVIEDQEAATAAFEKATNAIYSDEWWIKGDRTTGLLVEHKGEIWEFVESGELVYALGRVKAEDAADLYALCVEAAREAGWKEAVKPEQLKGIVSATLRVRAQEFPLADAGALDKLEAMLGSSKYVLGGTGCPFTALLDVETETGEMLTIALATDSCGAWMSEGYYYEFSGDSQPLYDLFGVTLQFGEVVK